MRKCGERQHSATGHGWRHRVNLVLKIPTRSWSGNAIGRCGNCAVRRTGVCGAVPEYRASELAQIATDTVARPGEAFIQEGGPADAFFNVSGGTARIYKLLSDGRRQIVGFAGAGHFLGLASGAAYAFSAEAIDTVTYCRFPRSRFHALTDRVPSVEKIMLHIATIELIAAQEQMVLLGRKTARERLASFLVARHMLSSGGLGLDRSFALPMSRSDIADYLGLSVETICRTFTRLRLEGLIEIVGISRIIVLDSLGLETLAEGVGYGLAPPEECGPRMRAGHG